MFVLVLLAGLGLLVFGAELLVRGGGRLALALRVPVIVVGLTIVAFGTSMPELIVSVTAAMQASTEMALANVTGSNIANIALVLGIAAMVRPLDVGRDLMRREVPACLLLQVLVPMMLLGDATVTRFEGAMLFAVGLIYNVTLVRDAMTGRSTFESDDEIALEGGVLHNLTLMVGGMVVLIGGGYIFVGAAQELAAHFGMSDRVIGLTVLALGTSMPEVMTGVVSAYRGHTDMAVGNSLGSNILNIAMVLGVTAMIEPVVIREAGAWKDLAVAIVVTMILVPVVLRGRPLSRVEGGFLILAYLLYLSTLSRL